MSWTSSTARWTQLLAAARRWRPYGRRARHPRRPGRAQPRAVDGPQRRQGGHAAGRQSVSWPQLTPADGGAVAEPRPTSPTCSWSDPTGRAARSESRSCRWPEPAMCERTAEDARLAEHEPRRPCRGSAAEALPGGRPRSDASRPRGRRSLTDVIVELGLAPRDAVDDALRPPATGTPPSVLLLARGAISPDGLAVALAERYGLDYVDLTVFYVDMAPPTCSPAGREALRGAAGRVHRRPRAAGRDGRSRRTCTRSTTSRS